ncbi:TPA: hypothetical protein HA335_06270 [Methanocaldococcus jannaschii]|uniref:Uncharacterized protein MJ1471 n=2 Tax=Methanocaldococcus jannaschii TaxID=2190 RepID=Y1471_METJA|nr:hypothetical protein [Methanocaldococcus jannaschii]Q58866.1 RecName: Full=Uncharacterized protein MJ1471 [Methanocaldococcus jannaschii DSM 2661]AAB99486.1 hypothetical protein MJ_1471 [Methanocaldococcus jannaschii DSM 2661]HII60153.1 hypothetical protein [Methanocaldococcus jannaschii]
MINSVDLAIGTAILLIGMAYWTVSIVEHNNNYVDIVKSDYIFDKGISTMEHLSEDGTLQDAVLLYYFDRVNDSKKLLEERIPLKHYLLYIDNNLLINKSNGVNNSNSVYILTVLTLNRSEGWYVIYGNEDFVNISKERFLDYDDAYNYLKYRNYDIHMPVYLSKNVSSSRVELYILGN